MKEIYFNSYEIQKICISFLSCCQTFHHSYINVKNLTDNLSTSTDSYLLTKLNVTLSRMEKISAEINHLQEILQQILQEYSQTETFLCSSSVLPEPELSLTSIPPEEETNWQTLFQQYFSSSISPHVFMKLYEISEKINTLDTDTILLHKSRNQSAWNNYQSNHKNEKYIEHQIEMKDIQYGFFSGDTNTCGVIATYNALQSLTQEKSADIFPDLLEYYEQEGIALNGAIGTAPKAIDGYFRKNGYHTKLLTGNDISLQILSKVSQSFCTYILLSQNDKSSITSGLHYVSITVENNKYHIHNGNSKKTYNSLTEAIHGYNHGKGKPVSLLCLK